jgi:hypothetical protein
MKSIKTLRFTKSVIAIAIAITAGGFSTSGFAIEQAGTPSGGMVCRSSYGTGFISGTAFICNKSTSFKMDLSCDNPAFPTYVNRARNTLADNGPNDTDLRNGLDICTRARNHPAYANIGPTDSLVGVAQSTNGTTGAFEIAKVNAAQMLVRIANKDQEEASALGLNVSQVETEKMYDLPSLNTGAADIKDQRSVSVRHYTFAIPRGGIVTAPVGTPVSTFVPRPLQ